MGIPLQLSLLDLQQSGIEYCKQKCILVMGRECAGFNYLRRTRECLYFGQENSEMYNRDPEYNCFEYVCTTKRKQCSVHDLLK